jgi:precorrin-6B methylase 2
VGEWLELLWLRVVVACRNSIEWARVVWRFYFSPTPFWRWDLALLRQYAWKNPFCISRSYLEKQGASDLHLYGETPLTTLALIAQYAGWHRGDTLFELGAGRGRTCFWLRAFVDCRVVAIEQVPEFVAKAQSVQQRYIIDRLEFRCGDMLNADLTGATGVYLYGTCLSDEEIGAVVSAFEQLAPGTQIVTVSYSLADFSSSYRTVKIFQAPFTWGVADVYIQEKLGKHEKT